MVELFLFSMLLGLFAGLLAGLFGLGGGVVIVPALVWLFSAHNFPDEMVMIMAVATSLTTIIFTSIASILAHSKLGNIQWGSVIRLSPGVLFGAGGGAIVAALIDAEHLKWFFVSYLIYVGTRMALPQGSSGMSKKAGQWIDYWAGNAIGFLSSILGIGGGTLTVPYLLARQVPMKNAVAVSSACGLPIAISGTIVYAILGKDNTSLPELSVGYIYLPALIGIIVCSILTAPIGAKLANKLPAKKLKRYFSIVLFVIAFKMIVR
jgi:uncharacterized membrane protein YfcA